jgi:hypothetical protein
MNSLTSNSLLLLALATLTPASALDRFVSPTGSDSAAGTLTAPWKTFQKAANTARAGDTVFLRTGNYRELVQVNVSGTATAPITFRPYNTERVTMDLTGVSPRSDLSAAIRIPSRSYVTVQGIEISNLRTSSESSVPVGILVDGSSAGVKLLNNKITKIEQNNTVKGNFDANAHGIAVYGTTATGVSNITISGNELSFLRLGASEALVLNGNVNGFTVSNNKVFNCNNIGIDVIGYEGTCSTASLDRARNGKITGNTVYNIDSAFNPAYDGHLTNGGGYRAAAGIYVDGGTSVTIERNHVYGCNMGVELASEWSHGKTDFITVRSNILRHNHQAGIIMGGYDADRGVTENCTVTNNTLYSNDTTNSWSGQVQFQFYVKNNKFTNNIIWARSDNKLVVNHYTDDSGSSSQRNLGTTNTFSYNLYFCIGGSSSNVAFQSVVNGVPRAYTGLAAWQRSGLCGGEAGTSVTNPSFVGGTPSTTATTASFALASTSAAINTGTLNVAQDLSNMDIFGDTRIKGSRIDRGADEF